MSGPIQLALIGRHRSIDERFADFCTNNPRIVAEFERRALALIARGREHFSADAILHAIRFDTAMSEAGGDFKVNNNHASRLARAFMEKYPQHQLFATRKLVAA